MNVTQIKSALLFINVFQFSFAWAEKPISNSADNRKNIVASKTLRGAKSRPQLKQVLIGALDGLSEIDTKASDKFRKSYEAAFAYAMGRTAKELESCGYSVALDIEQYAFSDTLAPREGGEKLAARGAWIIFAPTNSKHFILSTQGSNQSVFVSAMAGSNAVYELKPPFFTMYPSVGEFAKHAIKTARSLDYGQKFGSFIATGCLSCADFHDSFVKMAKPEFDEAFSFEFSGDTPNLQNLKTALKKDPVDFLLVPNSSRPSGYIVSELKNEFPNLKFIGTDGWGNAEYSLMTGYDLGKNQQGFCVRGDLGAADMSALYRGGFPNFALKGQKVDPSYSAFVLNDFFDILTRKLCEFKPADRVDFLKYFTKASSSTFRPRTLLGVFSLKNGLLQFEHELSRK